jgi:hypothetical protein
MPNLQHDTIFQRCWVLKLWQFLPPYIITKSLVICCQYLGKNLEKLENNAWKWKIKMLEIETMQGAQNNWSNMIKIHQTKDIVIGIQVW